MPGPHQPSIGLLESLHHSNLHQQPAAVPGTMFAAHTQSLYDLAAGILQSSDSKRFRHLPGTRRTRLPAAAGPSAACANCFGAASLPACLLRLPRSAVDYPALLRSPGCPGRPQSAACAAVLLSPGCPAVPLAHGFPRHPEPAADRWEDVAPPKSARCGRLCRLSMRSAWRSRRLRTKLRVWAGE